MLLLGIGLLFLVGDTSWLCSFVQTSFAHFGVGLKLLLLLLLLLLGGLWLGLLLLRLLYDVLLGLRLDLRLRCVRGVPFLLGYPR